LSEPALYRSRHRPRGSDYLLQVERGHFGTPRLCSGAGYGFFPSPNHLRILAIRLATGQLYDDRGRFANGFAKPSQTGGRGDHLFLSRPSQSTLAN
jgi:hypothetical protein